MEEKFKEKISWTLSILDTIDFLAWRTKQLLGVSKTQMKEISKLAEKNIELKKEDVEKIKEINSKWLTPDQAMYKLRFFSEDYLNKEFDIFMNLVSNRYKNTLYSKIFNLKKGKWNSYGNGASFKELINNIDKLPNEVQMDNLVYDYENQVLIANELKLGAEKNEYQILKYSYLFLKLKEYNLVAKNTKFYLLFWTIDKKEINNNVLEEEISKLKDEKKKDFLTNNDILSNSQTIIFGNILWKDFIEFNEGFLNSLDSEKQETEIKLIEGLNNSLKEKKLIKKTMA